MTALNEYISPVLSLLTSVTVHISLAQPRTTLHPGDDTDLPTNIEAAEEIQGVAEEDGIKFTGFNLREERTTGYFDEEGNYVERKNSDDEDAQDAWLQSDGGMWVSLRVGISACGYLCMWVSLHVGISACTHVVFYSVWVYIIVPMVYMVPTCIVVYDGFHIHAGAVVSEAVRKRIEQQQQQQEAADTVCHPGHSQGVCVCGCASHTFNLRNIPYTNHKHNDQSKHIPNTSTLHPQCSSNTSTMYPQYMHILRLDQ